MDKFPTLKWILFIPVIWFGLGATALLASQEVQIEEVQVRMTAHSPVLLLRVGEKAIPIFVDPTVAGSIQGALTGKKYSRPLSHDLMHTILEGYDIHLDRVFITLRDGVYYGTLTMKGDGDVQLFDSRSSDAIALAIHFQCPIFVDDNLLEAAGKHLEHPNSSEGSEL